MAPHLARNIRNGAIVVALALIVWLVPGGGTSADVVSNVVSIVFIAAIGIFGMRLYRESRVSLMDLPSQQRVLLYGSLALAAFALASASRLWASGIGVVAWIGLVGIAVFGTVTVVRSMRSSY